MPGFFLYALLLVVSTLPLKPDAGPDYPPAPALLWPEKGLEPVQQKVKDVVSLEITKCAALYMKSTYTLHA
jgi:hypothetical protein